MQGAVHKVLLLDQPPLRPRPQPRHAPHLHQHASPLQILHNLSPQAYGEVLEPFRMSWSPGSAPHPSSPHAAGHCWFYLGLGAVARDQESWDCLFPNCGGNPKPFGGWALRAMSPGLCLSARLIAKAVLPCKHSSCPSWVHLALAMS